MIAGSVEPVSQFSDSQVYPRYLISRDALWKRFVATRYFRSPDLLRMAWGDPNADFRQDAYRPGASTADVQLWERFLAERPPDEKLQSIGFLRSSRSMPGYYNREFRRWLLARYEGNLDALNGDLNTQYASPGGLAAPYISIIGAALDVTPIIAKFYEFSATVPQRDKFAWDAGGYYRGVFLPRTLGPISAFNEKYGTRFASYREVPFATTKPEVGEQSWHFFVSKVLRPDFVTLTADGEAARKASGLGRDEFIRLKATAGELKVVSLDCLYADWVAAQGTPGARIPREALDRLAFEKEQGTWKMRFLTLNYLTVIDEVLVHGRAIMNTFILVVLTMGGALLVNPLAAYALSRFKLRKTYHILLFFLATIAFPAEVTMIPVFLQLKELNMLNTFFALVVPGLVSGFSIFLLKGFFDSLPKELYEAAEIDGASEWTMFWQITMTLSKPILAVIALGAFVSAYGAFFYALILAPKQEMWTVMVYIYQLRQSVDAPVVYASLILTAIPNILVFVFCQNIILRGIVVPSEK